MKTARNQVSGGLFLAIGAIAGGIWGGGRGTVSFGVAIGLGIGAAIAILIWLVDRMRR